MPATNFAARIEPAANTADLGRVQGQILRFGSSPIYAGEVLITPEEADEHSFFLWAGEMMLPWLQQEPEEDVVSPANLPEFMDRMEQIWLLRHGPDSILS